MVTLPKLVRDHSDLFTLVFGSSEIELLSVTPPENSSPQSICFLSHPSQIPLIENLQSPVWIATLSFWEKQGEQLKALADAKAAAVLTCTQLQIAMAHVLRYFDQRDKLRSFPNGISPMSWIDPTARIGSGVTIAPFTTIGPHAHIGDNTVIGPHCTIEGGTKLGQDCFLEAHVFVGRQCEIGNHCRIKPFASIGSDGFGYAPTPKGALKIPQIGNVVLEDYVDVGSGTCIDRATLSTTRVGFGTKIDNLVHIAHNCEVGRYCFVTACFAMAGSSKLGDFFMTGGATAVGDHVTIAEKVTLAGASVVTTNIDKSGAYGGHPIQPMQDFLRTRSIIAQLPEMRKQLNRIVKHLGLQDKPAKS